MGPTGARLMDTLRQWLPRVRHALISVLRAHRVHCKRVMEQDAPTTHVTRKTKVQVRLLPMGGGVGTCRLQEGPQVGHDALHTFTSRYIVQQCAAASLALSLEGL